MLEAFFDPKSVAVVGASTSPGKLVQIETYGAELHRIPGSREDTAHAALDAAQNTYYASHWWNPYSAVLKFLLSNINR